MPEIEHIYPDYSLYGINDTAYGFMTRGCPRKCDFCIVKAKEGIRSRKVANLSEFWGGQKFIKLMDANTFACPEWENVIGQLIESRSHIDFTQGVDIRIMNDRKLEMLKQVKTARIHFAWDRYDDWNMIVPKFQMTKDVLGWSERKMIVYVLCNYNTTIEQDLERIYKLRELGFWAYVMIYDKQNTSSKDEIRRVQRWCNNRMIFANTPRFDDYVG